MLEETRPERVSNNVGVLSGFRRRRRLCRRSLSSSSWLVVVVFAPRLLMCGFCGRLGSNQEWMPRGIQELGDVDLLVRSALHGLPQTKQMKVFLSWSRFAQPKLSKQAKQAKPSKQAYLPAMPLCDTIRIPSVRRSFTLDHTPSPLSAWTSWVSRPAGILSFLLTKHMYSLEGNS
jgi:hypothetical protein